MDLEDGELAIDLEEGEIPSRSERRLEHHQRNPRRFNSRNDFFKQGYRREPRQDLSNNQRNNIYSNGDRTQRSNSRGNPPTRPFWSQPTESYDYPREVDRHRTWDKPLNFERPHNNIFDYQHHPLRPLRSSKAEEQGFQNRDTREDENYRMTGCHPHQNNGSSYSFRDTTSNNSNRVVNIPPTVDKIDRIETDIYDLNDYELLLERHKLIQQQLKALNSIPKQLNVTLQNNKQDLTTSDSNGKNKNDLTSEDDSLNEPKPFEPFKLKPIRSKIPSLEERSITDAMERGILTIHIDNDIVPIKLKRKRRRGRRKVGKSAIEKRSSTENAAKQRLNLAKRTAILAEASGVDRSFRKGTNESFTSLGSDDYTEIPMEIDMQEQEDLRHFLDDNVVSSPREVLCPDTDILSQSSLPSLKPLITSPSFDKKRLENLSTNDIILPVKQLMVDLSSVATEQTEVIVDSSDDTLEMLLREQLLRSLAAKRGAKKPKPKAQSTVPQSKANPPPQLTLMKTISTSVVSRSSPQTLTTAVVSPQSPGGRSTPTSTTSTSKPQSSLALPIQKPVIIDLGAESETDESETEDEDSIDDTQLNGIENFLKEARQSSYVASSTPVKNKKGLTKDTSITDSTTDILEKPPSHLENVVDCIEKASSQLVIAKKRLKVDHVNIKKLGIQLTDKKLHLQKYVAKVKQLQSQLAAAEKLAVATLSLKTKLEERISNRQSVYGNRKSLADNLAEELMRAKSIVSESKRRTVEREELLSISQDSPKTPIVEVTTEDVIPFGNCSPSPHTSTELKPKVRRQSSSKISDLLNRNIAKAKLSLIAKANALTRSFIAPTMPIKSIKNVGENLNITSNVEDEVSKVAEKERLEKLEKELAAKLRRLAKPRQRKSSISKALNASVEDNNTKENDAEIIDQPTELKQLLKLRSMLAKRPIMSSNNNANSHIGFDILTRDHPHGDKTMISDLKKDVVLFPSEPLLVLGSNGLQPTNDLNSKEYRSPLFQFKSYRLSPYYRTKGKLSISSSTISNSINPKQPICLFDLTGKCNDEKCDNQHSTVFSETIDELLKDLLTYEQSLAGIHLKDRKQEKLKSINDFVDTFIGQYKDKMSDEQLVLLLVQKIRDRQRKFGNAGYQNICVGDKSELPLKDVNINNKRSYENNEELQYNVKMSSKRIRTKMIVKNIEEVDNDTSRSLERYCSSGTDDKQILRETVEQNPEDISSWIRLGKKLLPSGKTPIESNKEDFVKALEPALNVLSQALEIKNNRSSLDLWLIYLDLYAKGSTTDELRHACYQAILHVPEYAVWWKCLELEKVYTEKQALCIEILSFLLGQPEDIPDRSQNCIETLLYLCCLEISLEHFDNAALCFRCSLGMTVEEEPPPEQQAVVPPSLIEYLSLQDRCLLWSIFIYFIEYNTIPTQMFGNKMITPTKLVNKTPFFIEFEKERVSASKDVLICALLEDALKDAYRYVTNSDDVFEYVVPLHKALVDLLVLHNRLDEVRLHFEKVSTNLESSAVIWLLYLRALFTLDAKDEIRTAIPAACAKTNWDARVVLAVSQWHITQRDEVSALQLLSASIYQCFEEHQSSIDPRDLYRKLLGITGFHFSKSLPNVCNKMTLNDRKDEHSALWLCYCLLLRLQESVSTNPKYMTACEETFDLAVYSTSLKNHTVILWREYISYLRGKLQLAYDVKDEEKIDDMTRRLIDVAQRALMSDNPSKAVVFNSNCFWDDFTFQTDIMDSLFNVIDDTRHVEIYDHFKPYIWNNPILAEHIVKILFNIGQLNKASTLCSSVLANKPKSLALWILAIRIELQQQHFKETRWLFDEALKVLPYSHELWKHYLCFEVAQSKDEEATEKIISKILDTSSKLGLKWTSFISSTEAI